MDRFVPGTQIKKPVCPLVGQDGNAFSIIGRVSAALKRAGCPKEVLDKYRADSMSGDYDNLLMVATQYVEESGDEEEDEEEDEDFDDEDEEDDD